MHRVRGLLAVAAVAATVTACVSTNEIGGSDNPTPTTTTVVPTQGSFGADVTFGGVTATVQDVEAFEQSPNSVPRIKVVMRTENLSRSDKRNPDVELVCKETTNTGDWFLGSTWEPNVVLPVNAVSQGEVIIGFPLKGSNPEYPVVTCTDPQLRMTMLADVSTTKEGSGSPTAPTTAPLNAADVDASSGELAPEVIMIPIDPAIITQAIREPRGPVLPLPPTGS